MRRVNDDRGAVTVLVAILLPVVLLGMGALVLDVGQGYAERRQLQNGADAGALAVAREYAAASASCVPGAKAATADDYADRNANDSAGSDIAAVECPAANKVRVRTSTRSASGGFLPPILGQVLGGGNTTIAAQATVAWGPPASLTSGLPLTISECEFNFYTGSGSSLQPPPPYPPWPTDRVISFHDTTGGPTGCPSSASGSDFPGGFGWLEPDSAPAGSCVASTDDGGWVDDKTGVSVPGSDCRAKLAALRGQVVSLPVYDQVNGLNGNNGEYRIATYAAFVLTGYSFPGERAQSLVTNTHYCTPSQTCIYGFFTTDTTPASGTVGSGPSNGVTVVQMTE